MDAEKQNNVLYEKMSAEQRIYREWLLSLPARIYHPGRHSDCYRRGHSLRGTGAGALAVLLAFGRCV